MSYIEELGSVGAEAYNRSGERPAFPLYMDMAADAIATKVLLDLSEHARTQYGDMYGMVIDDWAIEKGIDLIGDEG